MDWKTFSCHFQVLKPLCIIARLVTFDVNNSGGWEMAAAAPSLLHGPMHSYSLTHSLIHLHSCSLRHPGIFIYHFMSHGLVLLEIGGQKNTQE